ncbi:MAG: bifunctional folylpolyglutamate synthase/dihydrofolate synthase [Spirochaetales bacterium]|nr:bifunctional folylpolyglutamate synthase/dihydrofolate synthase [Spirochaetales bacterium]
MGFKTFDQVVEYMEHFTNLERKTDRYSTRTYRLDRMQAIMDTLGNPQRSYRTIHVAGSKGKGSTASYIAAGLKAVGFRTGLYMSPHVSDYRERFTLCGSFVPDQDLVDAGNRLASALEGFRFRDSLGESEPTTFELYTAFAFLLFQRLGCQWAVIETGLGGRLDATNILLPEASVITPIELEHCDILGDTISKIAWEKSKIIKQNRPSFSAFQDPEALAVLRAEALSCSSAFSYLGDHVLHLDQHSVTYSDGSSFSLNLAMPGLVQAQNCALAILVLRTLGLFSPSVSLPAMESVALPGRMERIPWKRTLYLDGAHTQNSMGHLLETFRTLHPTGGVCIFGCVSGKNIDAMADEVLGCFDRIVVCRPGTYKRSDPQGIFDLLSSRSRQGQTVVLREDASEALKWVLENTTDDEPVLCCGSFYLAGVVKEALWR